METNITLGIKVLFNPFIKKRNLCNIRKSETVKMVAIQGCLYQRPTQPTVWF